jgi:hypothetical protein
MWFGYCIWLFGYMIRNIEAERAEAVKKAKAVAKKKVGVSWLVGWFGLHVAVAGTIIIGHHLLQSNLQSLARRCYIIYAACTGCRHCSRETHVHSSSQSTLTLPQLTSHNETVRTSGRSVCVQMV